MAELENDNMIENIQIEFINQKSIGPFTIGENISKYTSIYPYVYKKAEDEWDQYLFFDEAIEVYTNSEKFVQAIACRIRCYFGDVDLIGFPIENFMKILGIEADKVKIENIRMDDDEQQMVYDIEEFALQLWMDKNGRIVTVFLG